MGNKKGHKGKRRNFTNPQELEHKREKEEKEKEWRRKRGEILDSDEDDEEEDEEEEEKSQEEESEKNESEDEEPLIEISNPNRMPQKFKKNVDVLNDKIILSRRDKELIEKEKAREKFNKLHAEGKTKQAQEDLARLALIRQKREEAAKKRTSNKPQIAIPESNKPKSNKK